MLHKKLMFVTNQKRYPTFPSYRCQWCSSICSVWLFLHVVDMLSC